MSNKIKLKNVRLSYPSLFHKAQFNGEETKYEATLILDKEEHAKVIQSIQAQMKDMAAEAKVKVPKDKLCLKDGDDLDKPEYEGKFTIKAANNTRPTVIDRDKSPLVEEDNVVYAGCYVNAVVELWVQNNSWGRRINSNLLGVQFVKDGEAFGTEKVASKDDFDDIEDDFDDEDTDF